MSLVFKYSSLVSSYLFVHVGDAFCESHVISITCHMLILPFMIMIKHFIVVFVTASFGP